MTARVSRPDEPTLRDFLLGKLAPDRVEQVASWLSNDPSAADALSQVAVNDPLTDALADTSSIVAVPIAVERFVQSVLRELECGNTPLPMAATTTPVDGNTAATASWPAKLGDYRIVRQIGQGGMGVVLEAEDEQLHRRVAVKVMAERLATTPQARARFLREARAAAAIDHENVAPIHHVGEEGGVPFIVMPLLRGESLEDRLKREERLSPAEVTRLGREAAAGLAAAHACGLVHRDIKPANIWLAADTGTTKVLDFGLARAVDGTDGLTAEGASPGTPEYMSPEQVEGKAIDARSDLFSLGATLYRCATGRSAFHRNTITDTLLAVLRHTPPPPHEVNPAIPLPLSDLIVRLLAKEPSTRLQSAQQVIAGLEKPGAEVRPPEPAVTADGWSPVTSPDEVQQQRTWRGGPKQSRRRLAVGCSVTFTFAALLFAVSFLFMNITATGPPDPDRGQVDVLVERTDEEGGVHLLRLNQPGALPLRKTDKFRVEGRVDRPAYLYVVWVDPDHDVTPIYPWDATKGWGSRPAKEQKVSQVSLPSNAGNRYTAPDAKPGVATMVLFARSTPLDASDEEVRKWFEELPDLPLPAGGEQAVVWFDNYLEVRDPDRPRTFGEVGADDPFARWQGQLQKVLGDKAAFETAASFARTGGKGGQP